MSTSYGLNLPERLTSSVSRFEALARIAGRNLRVAIPGIVQSFDATKQTVVVRPALTETGYVSGQPITQWQTLVFVDIPIVLPRAGGFTLTMPVQAGDECLVVFCDSCIDAWWQSGGQQNQIEQRRHDLSDGIAILGTWSQPRVLSNYAANGAELRSDDGATKVNVSSNQVTVSAQTVKVTASGTATVTGSTINVTASQQVSIMSGGGYQTSIDGKPFTPHKHTLVQSGSSNSGPVA